MGALSRADEAAVETTTTSTIPTTTSTVIPAPIDLEDFEVSQIETGAQFQWENTLTFDGGYPLALIEHRGSMYLFVNEEAYWGGETGKLDLWEWEDSGPWRHSGTIAGAEHSITAVASNGDEVILVGTSVEGNALSVWRSTDLETWAREDIPIEHAQPYGIALPTAVGANGDLVVVAAIVAIDNREIIEDALREAGHPVDLHDFGWSLEREEVVIFGPFGMVLDRVPLADLGWDEDEQATIVQTFNGPPTLSTWVQRQGEDWRESELEGINGVESILPHPDGGLTARGWGTNGMVSLFSSDGLEWSEAPASQTPWMVRVWGDRLVGPGERSLPGLLVSDDGEIWEHIGPDERFPMSIHWSTDAVATGPDGLVFTTSGVAPGLPLSPPGPPAMTIDMSTGATLHLDFDTGRLEVETDDRTYGWEMYTQDGPDDGVTTDLETGTVIFSDPETGDFLGEVSYEDLIRMEEDYYRSREPESHRALVFTPDGETWSIQDVGAEFGDSGRIGHLAIGAGEVAAAVFPAWWLGVDGGFEVWTAPLP